MDELGVISQWRAIFAGGLAGVAAALTTYPLEVVETRLVVQNCREPTYIGIVHTLSKIYRSEGLLALYKGFSLTVLGMCTQIGLRLRVPGFYALGLQTNIFKILLKAFLLLLTTNLQSSQHLLYI